MVLLARVFCHTGDLRKKDSAAATFSRSTLCFGQSISARVLNLISYVVCKVVSLRVGGCFRIDVIVS